MSDDQDERFHCEGCGVVFALDRRWRDGTKVSFCPFCSRQIRSGHLPAKLEAQVEEIYLRCAYSSQPLTDEDVQILEAAWKWKKTTDAEGWSDGLA
jgi:hypothetical protein